MLNKVKRSMKLLAAIGFAMVLAAVSTTVAAQQGKGELATFFASYESQKIAKDPFETTEAHAARLQKFANHEFELDVPVQGAQGTAKSWTYDADKQLLTVELGGHARSQHIFWFGADGRVPASAGYAKYVFEREPLKLTRKYPAQNAFGATFEVSEFYGAERGVTLLNIPISAVAQIKAPSLTVTMAPDVARTTVEHLGWRLRVRTAVVPQMQAFVLDEPIVSKATFAEPSHVVVSSKSLPVVALKIQLIDMRTGTVIAELPPKSRGS
jgi:hypothetical protein